MSSVTTAEVMLREEKKCLSLEASVYHQEMGESRSVEKYTFDAYERRTCILYIKEEGQC